MPFVTNFWKKIKIFLHFIRGDNRFIKICFIALTSYLLFNELTVFLITKPTFTSVTQTNMKPNDFPDILICPKQGFHLHSLHKLGYQISTHYGRGETKFQKNLVTWIGNQTKMNITEVADQVSTVKTSKDCPLVEARFQRNGNKYIFLDVELTRAMYPNGRCCRVIKPKEAEKYSILKVN